MKNRAFLFVSAALAAFLITLGVAFGQAQQTRNTFRIDFNEQNVLYVFNTCPGGQNGIFKKGFLEWNSFMVTAQSGQVFMKSEFRLNAEGVGLTTDHAMKVSGVENYPYSGNPEGFHYGSIGKFTLNTQGPGGDLRGKFNFQIAWDPVKGFQFRQDSFRFECR